MNALLFPLHTVYRGAQCLGISDVSVVLHLPASECRSQRCPKGYDVRSIERDELATLLERKQIAKRVGVPSDLDDRRRGLVGVFHEDKAVSFLWLAKQSINSRDFSRASQLGTSIDMPDGTAFVFNAWTEPSYRGQRLVSTILTHATRNRICGAWSLLTLVDWSNTRARRAFSHSGVQTLGTVYRIGRGPLQVNVVPNAAKRIGLRIADDAPGFKVAC